MARKKAKKVSRKGKVAQEVKGYTRYVKPRKKKKAKKAKRAKKETKAQQKARLKAQSEAHYSPVHKEESTWYS